MATRLLAMSYDARMRFPVRALLALLLASGVTAQGKNLLFYGNSFTYYSWGYGVPELVSLIATEAGHPAPFLKQALVGGSTLTFHATDPGQVGLISTSLPAGQTWDHVIMQGRAPEATTELGFNPTQFRSDSVQITQNVRNHSPDAGAVMYQTWAAAWGHYYYAAPPPWYVPLDMHNEIRTNYRLAAADIDAAFGAGTGRVAAVGDAIGLLEWDPVWFETDLEHPSPAMILAAAMVIYSTIYEQTVCEIEADFSVGSALSNSLSPFGLGEADWNFLAGIADRSAAAPVRRYPGSADHLLLESATDATPLSACPSLSVTTGTPLQLRMRSMNSVYDTATGALLIDFIVTGAPPGPSPLYPELQVDLGGSIVSPLVSLGSALSIAIPVPFSLPGGSFLVQGIALQSSSETGNAAFTTTDAHELVFY